MGMDTHVRLLRDGNSPDHQAKLAVLRSCLAAGVSLPKEIDDYFNGEYDEDFPLEVAFEARRWSHEMGEGYEVDIDDLPEGVKTIRFYNSW